MLEKHDSKANRLCLSLLSSNIGINRFRKPPHHNHRGHQILQAPLLDKPNATREAPVTLDITPLSVQLQEAAVPPIDLFAIYDSCQGSAKVRPIAEFMRGITGIGVLWVNCGILNHRPIG